MTWLDEDIEKVEKIIFEADENTKHRNEINEVFEGETWIVDFYEICRTISDYVEEYCESENIDEISEDKLLMFIDEHISIYLNDFKKQAYKITREIIENEGQIGVNYEL